MAEAATPASRGCWERKRRACLPLPRPGLRTGSHRHPRLAPAPARAPLLQLGHRGGRHRCFNPPPAPRNTVRSWRFIPFLLFPGSRVVVLGGR